MNNQSLESTSCDYLSVPISSLSRQALISTSEVIKYLPTPWPQQPHSRIIQTKNISRLQHIRISAGLKNLLTLPSPLRLIDRIDIILDFQNHATILLDRSWAIGDIEESLCRFERHGSVLPPAGVDLEGLLVGVNFELDPGPGGADACDEGGTPVEGLWAVGQVAGVCVCVN